MLRLVYIAGPYRGPHEFAVRQNVRAAEALAVEVWRLGAVAVCPHKNTSGLGGVVPDAAFLAGVLEILRRCDAVLVTGNWRDSAGARVEVAEAGRLGLPVFDNATALGEWLADPSAAFWRTRQDKAAKATA